MSNWFINLGNGESAVWSPGDVKNVLNGVKYADKKVNWIRADLSIGESNWFSRMMWCIAKHFDWMRKAFYNIDLENSRSILNQLRQKISSNLTNTDKTLIKLFNDAAKNFNSIAPNHYVNTIFEEPDYYPVVEEPAYVTTEPPGGIYKSPLPMPTAGTYKKPTGPSGPGSFGPAVPDFVPTAAHTVDPFATMAHSIKTGSSVDANLLNEMAAYNHGKLNYNSAASIVGHPTHKPGTYLIRQSTDSDNMVVTVLLPTIPTPQAKHIRFRIEGAQFRDATTNTLHKTLPEMVKANHGGDLLYPIRNGAAHPGSAGMIGTPDPVQQPKPLTPQFAKVSPSPTGSPAPFKKVPTPEPTKAPETVYLEEFKAGKNVDDLFEKAFNDGLPAICAWLLKKGADINAFKSKIANAESDSDIPPGFFSAPSASELKLTDKQKALLNWLELSVKPVARTPENLDHFAIDLGLGYKSANLMVMEANTEEMNKKLDHAIVKVPPFLPVGDFELFDYLQKEVPGVMPLWNKFKASFDPALKSAFNKAATNEQASKSGMKITLEGETILNEIGELIQKHFWDKPYYSPQMREWLEKEKPQFVIVRSTGKEDSDTNSNAGGNASIPYVKPNEKDISTAIGEVIASYFGEKSINQRILCGDRSLFEDDKPFIPILIQEMVGENVGGVGSKHEDIPRCGVLFTRQSDKAEGVTFINTGLGNNEGVVTSQVGVDSYYVKDRKIHAVVRRKETRYVSQAKADGTMGVAAIKNQDEVLEYSQALHPRIILDLKQVADDVSGSYAKKQGSFKPMDMEYTIKLKEKGYKKPVIYLLQARPLLGTKGDKEVKPSYLDLNELKTVDQSAKINAEVLLDGNAYVRTIVDPKSVIFADDLPKGEYDYAHTSDDVRVIVINKTAPATSHEAVILRPKGVAVLVVDDTDDFEKLKKQVYQASADKPVLFDTQRGMIVSCPDKKTGDSLIKEGLVSYPIPLEVTVPPAPLMRTFKSLEKKLMAKDKNAEAVMKAQIDSFNNSVDDLIERLRGVELELHAKSGEKLDWNEKGVLNKYYHKEAEIVKNMAKAKDLLPISGDDKYGLAELFDLMATGDTAQAKLALATVLDIMRNYMAHAMKKTDTARADINRPMFQAFAHAVHLAKTEIAPAMEKYPAQSLERLYPIKFLNALLFQKFNRNVMGGSSYMQVMAKDRAQREAIKNGEKFGVNFAGPNGSKLITLQQSISMNFNEECATNWQTMVRDFGKMDQKSAGPLIDQLLAILSRMNALGIGSLWMNSTFNTIWKSIPANGDIRLKTLVANLKSTLAPDDSTLTWVQNNLGSIEQYETQSAPWAEPAYGKKNTGKLIVDFTTKLGFDKNGGPNSLKALFNNANPLGKLAILQYIRRAVNAYDCLIKAAKGSDKFKSDKDRALQVAEMLEGYFQMMEACMDLIPVPEQQAMQAVNMGSAVYFPGYIQRLKNGGNYNFGFSEKHSHRGFNDIVSKLKLGQISANEQLEARPHFAVDALIIGSKADLNFSAHWPDRLEEYFTTFHQNMEQVVKYLNTKNGLDASLLAKQAREICDQAKSTFKQEISYLTSENGRVQVGYQIPLRQHSGSMIITYNPQDLDKGVEVTVQMFGNDEHLRWDWGAACGAILAYQLGDGFAKGGAPKINYNKPEGVEFTFKLPGKFAQVDKLIASINYITKIQTMGSQGSTANLLSAMQTGHYGLGAIDWNKINPECFKYSLLSNSALIADLVSKNQHEAAAKVAMYSLKGMAHYGLDDYSRGGSSLRTTAIQTLQSLITKVPTLAHEFKEFVNDPDVSKRFGSHLSVLKQELSKLMSPEDAFAKFMTDKDYAEAIVIAIKTKKPQLAAHVVSLIANKLNAGETNLLLDLFIKLSCSGYEKEASDLIMKGLEPKLSTEQKKKLDVLKQKEARAKFQQNLTDSVAELHKLVPNFELNHEAIMKHCVDALIGLSQYPDYNSKSFTGFGQLGNYLGKPAYSYILDNQYGDTSKLRKAGPLYIIKGLESKNPAVRNSAVEALKRLALDYVLFASKEPYSAEINHVMFALARAYIDTADRPKTAVRELHLMFQEDKSILQKFAISPQVPLGTKKDALDTILATL